MSKNYEYVIIKNISYCLKYWTIFVYPIKYFFLFKNNIIFNFYILIKNINIFFINIYIIELQSMININIYY